MALVEYELQDRTAIIRFNRPERLNAFSFEMVQAIGETFARFRADEQAWVAVLTGNGRSFSAGRDLKIEVSSGRMDLSRNSVSPSPFYLTETDKPVIAAVNGYAIGAGFYVALGCDMRVAGASAEFGMGEIPTGLLGPYWLSAAESLPWPIAMELTLIGDRISAARALELGLVNQVVPDDDVLEAALRLAGRLAKLPPLQVRRTKAMMTAMRRVPSPEMLAWEYRERGYLNALEDTKEAATAWVEKREPLFMGR